MQKTGVVTSTAPFATGTPSFQSTVGVLIKRIRHAVTLPIKACGLALQKRNFTKLICVQGCASIPGKLVSVSWRSAREAGFPFGPWLWQFITNQKDRLSFSFILFSLFFPPFPCCLFPTLSPLLFSYPLFLLLFLSLLLFL
jgi:hypothetical protein